MNYLNLQFFDKDGYNLNFNWNERQRYWEGFIYLPKVSVGLYANTSIYVLEKGTVNGNESFFFPRANLKGYPENISFKWEHNNTFVDEFFMFNFDEEYLVKDTSALNYVLNDGPDCNTLLVNRFDEYVINLEYSNLNCTDVLDPERPKFNPLPIHVAFLADEKYDETTYNRTLVMYQNGNIIAKIKFFAETIEEDERLKIWNKNLGYNITPEDEAIFYKSDIKEYKPDYQLLNEKRKELMLEGHNIYPYIGSYKALINAIKFFGYDNLGIIEFWRNVNTEDENFGKVYHTSRYSLTKKETLRVGTRNITLPNKDYKKASKIALVYSINTPTGKVDDWELPIMKEEFTYTIEEALIKLYALKKKLNKEFMPSNTRIIDIIGEANYFGLQLIKKINVQYDMYVAERKLKANFNVTPSKYLHITDDRYFDNYIVKSQGYKSTTTDDTAIEKNTNRQFNILSDIYSKPISDFKDDEVTLVAYDKPTNLETAKLYERYYDYVHNKYYIQENTFDVDDTFAPASAKVVLTNTTFDSITFGDCDFNFGYKFVNLVEVKPDIPSETETDPFIGGDLYTDKTINEDDQPGLIIGNKLTIQHGSCRKLVVTKIPFKESPTIYYSTTVKLDESNYKEKGSTLVPTEQGMPIGKVSVYWYAEKTKNYKAKSGTATVNIIRYTLKEDETATADEDLTFTNIGTFGRKKLKWVITMSSDQIDDDLKISGKIKRYEYKDWTFTKEGTLEECEKIFVKLPYIGYYTVSLIIDDIYIKTKQKCIKVEPYNVELKGFYYDARELSDEVKYEPELTSDGTDENEYMIAFVKEKLKNMLGWAIAERTSQDNIKDMSMPTYSAKGDMTNTGPYFNANMNEEWYLADNLTYEMSYLMDEDSDSDDWTLKYVRYIHNGVDVKPYTWFLLGYEYSKIVGKINPVWTIINNNTGHSATYSGKYFTLLLKEEGNYTVKLNLQDNNGNNYEVSRNIFVVSKDANYKMYNTFKKEYEDYTTQKLLLDSRELMDIDIDLNDKP